MTQVAPVIIAPAGREDVTVVEQLLEINHLPTAGLREHWATTIVALDAGRIVGSAALEVYRESALLRSVAVEPSRHGGGLGQQLVAAALEMARARGIVAIYLLTTTVEAFFKKFGFESITRADAPAAVRHSIEFTTACPASALVMIKVLRDS